MTTHSSQNREEIEALKGWLRFRAQVHETLAPTESHSQRPRLWLQQTVRLVGLGRLIARSIAPILGRQWRRIAYLPQSSKMRGNPLLGDALREIQEEMQSKV